MSDKVLKALNDQFNFEMQSGYLYLGMAGYCAAENMNGMAHFFIKQAYEEFGHAMKFFGYINDIDGRVTTQAMPEPRNEFNSFLECFSAALEHEKKVTGRIYSILELAKEEKHYPTAEFLQWFVKEQVEEEANFRDIVAKLEKVNENFQGLMLLDKELGMRE